MEVQAHGFGGLMTAVVGVNTNGEVTGVAITSHNETLSTGTQALESDYLDQYKGKSGTIRSSGSNAVDTISGATATCNAVTDCVQPGPCPLWPIWIRRVWNMWTAKCKSLFPRKWKEAVL